MNSGGSLDISIHEAMHSEESQNGTDLLTITHQTTKSKTHANIKEFAVAAIICTQQLYFCTCFQV